MAHGKIILVYSVCMFVLMLYVLGCFSHSRIQPDAQSDQSLRFAYAHFVSFAMPLLKGKSHLSTVFVCLFALMFYVLECFSNSRIQRFIGPVK